MAPSKRSRVARLMLKAVRNLPEKEQEVVLEYLFESGLGSPGGTTPQTKRAERATSARIVRGALGPDQQMIPVRLSEPQHRLLKDWCEENGFPMAVVVRGLVERFLEERQRHAA